MTMLDLSEKWRELKELILQGRVTHGDVVEFEKLLEEAEIESEELRGECEQCARIKKALS